MQTIRGIYFHHHQRHILISSLALYEEFYSFRSVYWFDLGLPDDFKCVSYWWSKQKMPLFNNFLWMNKRKRRMETKNCWKQNKMKKTKKGNENYGNFICRCSSLFHFGWQKFSITHHNWFSFLFHSSYFFCIFWVQRGFLMGLKTPNWTNVDWHWSWRHILEFLALKSEVWKKLF